MEKFKISGHDGLIRDAKTNAIINMNFSEHQEYIKRREIKDEESRKIQKLESDIGNMKSDLEEIKFLLRSIKNES